MEEECVLYKPDGTVEKVRPGGAKFTKEELEHAVGGRLLLIPCRDSALFFTVSRAANESSDMFPYNIHANYLYRRYVGRGKELRGNVLLCGRELLELTHIIFFSGIVEEVESESELPASE